MAKKSAITGTEPIGLIYGKEHFLIEHYSQELRNALRDVHGEIEEFRFSGETTELASVLDELRSYGLMQSYKLVIVDEADAFLKRDEGSYRKAMERYVDQPVDHATLVLRAETWNRGKLDKKIADVGFAVKCDALSDGKASAWCVKRAKAQHGRTLEPDAANLLVERLGTSLVRLDSELAKLAASVEETEAMTVEHVRSFVGKSREEQAWELQDAILSGDPGIALRRMHELREISRTADELLMWSMMDLCRKLHHASCMLRQGGNHGTISKELRLWGPAGKRVTSIARKRDPHTFASLFQRVIRADAQRKSGLLSSERGLETLAATLADTIR